MLDKKEKNIEDFILKRLKKELEDWREVKSHKKISTPLPLREKILIATEKYGKEKVARAINLAPSQIYKWSKKMNPSHKKGVDKDMVKLPLDFGELTSQAKNIDKHSKTLPQKRGFHLSLEGIINLRLKYEVLS